VSLTPPNKELDRNDTGHLRRRLFPDFYRQQYRPAMGFSVPFIEYEDRQNYDRRRK
jgi:hypothetical protein